MMFVSCAIIALFLLAHTTHSGVTVGGTLRKSTVWNEAESPYYVVSDVGVPPNLTLTIEAGVQIIFDNDFEILIKGGSLKVLGTTKQFVRFTSGFAGKKWMVTFKASNLSQSIITSAQFSGPKPAVQSANAENNPIQNQGELLLQFCVFVNGSEITSNGGSGIIFNETYFLSKSSLVLRNVFINDSKLTNGYGSMEPIYLVNSYIVNSSIRATASKYGIHLNSCVVYNTSIELFYGYPSTVHIDNSTLNNVYVKGNAGQTSTMLLSISRSTFQNGSITRGFHGTNIQLDDSRLIYVNVLGVAGDDDSYRQTYFALRHSTFDNGSLVLRNYKVDLISSNISLAQSPLVIGTNSIIQCSSITRTTETNENMIGIEANSIIIKESSIYNFRIGIRMFKTCTILSSNIYNNLLYNIENQGPYTIQAKENWWGTTNETEIDNKIYDYYDNLNFGQVVYSNYSMILLEHNNGNSVADLGFWKRVALFYM
ncbi:unnamed protein product [Adineta steineri]|uniref:Right handed beta helix domain-containing protein n=1 Tax=Adineta steineri TaxID=433720 RepID=A0A819DP34_9BILA|nr:unnamed protein product [Adineta steineri]CAF3838135.1 unnamed protein product [Adineta steineri]